MFIFIEGNDGCGKSTLARALSDRLGLAVVKYSKRSDKACVDRLYDVLQRETIIFDRSFITDMVYRSFDKLPTNQMDLLSIAKCLSTNIIKIVWCKTKNSLKTLADRENDEDGGRSAKEHAKIDATYDCVMSLIESFTGVKVFEYDYTKDSVDQVIKFLNI